MSVCTSLKCSCSSHELLNVDLQTLINFKNMGFSRCLREVNRLTPEIAEANLRHVDTCTNAEMWVDVCSFRVGWIPYCLTLPVSVAAAMITENGFELVHCPETETKHVYRMIYGDKNAGLILKEENETDDPMLAPDKVHFFPKSWVKNCNEEYYANALKGAGVSEEQMIGSFWISGRYPRSYHSKLNKHQFRNWLRGKTECVVCFEETGFCIADDILTPQMCNECGTVICLSCFVDLVMSAEAIGGEKGQFPCTVCRSQNCGELNIACDILESERVFEHFSKAKKKFIRMRAARCKPTTAPKLKAKKKRSGSEQSKRPRRDGCQKCGKCFWDKKAYKRALKCKKCKKAAYCSAKCRKAHRKEHSETCAR